MPIQVIMVEGATLHDEPIQLERWDEASIMDALQLDNTDDTISVVIRNNMAVINEDEEETIVLVRQ